MKLLFSVPSGYHVRELLLPLRRHLQVHSEISEVHVVTPAAPIADEVFPEFGSKFFYHENPRDDAGHKELFSRINPDVVITNTVGHDALDEPILRSANDMEIPTVTFIASWDNVWKIERLILKKIPIAIPSRFIVWNEMMKDHLFRIFPFIDEHHVAVIGAPRLDYFFEKEMIASKETVYAALGFEDISRPFIHIATTELYPVEYVVKALRHGIDTGALPYNPYLYASVHPGGNMNKHASLEAYGATVRFSPGRREHSKISSFLYAPTEKDIFFLLGVFMHATVLVNHSSTVALESLIAKVPVVNVKYGKPLDWWGWKRSMVYRDFEQHYQDLISGGATYIVKSRKELMSATKLALENPHAKDGAADSTIQRMITTTDGSAGQKVLAYILSV